ncbi:uncharacterized protein LOC123970623 isoform X2 [Micropterus dolomieu]|uniref:uncharacterized protein LOC123970623 isoform X2 n=1 Tax=Micropterus dolomieu TaxID=147949 RepID=UPI001E8EB9D1|nr:uncharacterized protein LOC123970623 isoform X2 [Micropterus dolomieu]
MMEMWLKRSTLVLLTAVAAMGISGQRPVVLNETQYKVEVPFGSSVTFHCRLKIFDTWERYRVNWYFNPSGCSFTDSHQLFLKMGSKSANTSTMVSKGPKDAETLLNYNLSAVTYNNSGWYFCSVTVEIPVLTVLNTSGTHVTIAKSIGDTTYPSLPTVTGKQVPPTDDNSSWWMWIALGVSAFILIVLLVICVLLRRRHSRSREDPIYANTRRVVSKQPSPRPGMPEGNLKMVSSSQDLRNPSPSRRHDEGKLRYKH